MRPATVGPLTPRTIRHQAASSAQKLGRDMSPTNLRVILVSSRFMTVTWGVPDYPADISGYVIYYKEVGAQRFVLGRMLNKNYTSCTKLAKVYTPVQMT